MNIGTAGIYPHSRTGSGVYVDHQDISLTPKRDLHPQPPPLESSPTPLPPHPGQHRPSPPELGSSARYPVLLCEHELQNILEPQNASNPTKEWKKIKEHGYHEGIRAWVGGCSLRWGG